MIAPLRSKVRLAWARNVPRRQKVIPKIVHEGVAFHGTLAGEPVRVSTFVGRKTKGALTIDGFGLKIVWKNQIKTQFFFEGDATGKRRLPDFFRAAKVLERLVPALISARERSRPIERRTMRLCIDLAVRDPAEVRHTSLRNIARRLNAAERAELLDTLHALQLESKILEKILHDTRPRDTEPASSQVNGTGPLRTTSTHYLDPRVGLPNSS